VPHHFRLRNSRDRSLKPFPFNVQAHVRDFKECFASGQGFGLNPNALAWLRCRQGDTYLLDDPEYETEYLRICRVSRCGGKGAIVGNLQGMEKPVALLANSPPPHG
jgi:hypothetical protein